MPSPYEGFLWRENEESIFWSSHPLADKTNNEHLRKPFFKVENHSIVLLLNLLLFCRSRSCRRRRCLSSPIFQTFLILFSCFFFFSTFSLALHLSCSWWLFYQWLYPSVLWTYNWDNLSHRWGNSYGCSYHFKPCGLLAFPSSSYDSWYR